LIAVRPVEHVHTRARSNRRHDRTVIRLELGRERCGDARHIGLGILDGDIDIER